MQGTAVGPGGGDRTRYGEYVREATTGVRTGRQLIQVEANESSCDLG